MNRDGEHCIQNAHDVRSTDFIDWACQSSHGTCIYLAD